VNRLEGASGSGASASPGARFPAAWWHRSVGYEIYVRSFADADGDGVGDLAGIRRRLDHLEWLGVDLLWLTPIFPSPLHDHGYDVADYCAVHPDYGTLEALDALIADVHGRGMRLLLDLVPNHTSSEHGWFRRARSSREDPYRDYYIWRDPAPGGGPPNNWVSVFGGGAWTFDETTGQYYLHLFEPEQPDLNWQNRAVHDEFEQILRFWFERGVDGFRIDVAHGLAKHPDLPDLPGAFTRADAEHLFEPAEPSPEWEALEHVHDVDQPANADIYRRWRKVADEYDALLLGEVYVLDLDALARYVRDQDGLHMSFWFQPLHMRWSPEAVRHVIDGAVRALPGHLTWVQSTHDRPRPVSRFGRGPRGRARALAFATLLFGLPGTPFLYQGEELGLDDGEVPPGERQDPVAVRHGHDGRDGCRTPMPWAPDAGLGFTSAARAWLPFGARSPEDTLAVQRDDPEAPVHRYRRLAAVRRERRDLHDAPFRWLVEDGPVVAYERGEVIVAANCGDVPATVRLPEGGRVLFGSDGAREGRLEGAELRLEGCEAVVLAP
jgi:alpha-glucosidase